MQRNSIYPDDRHTMSCHPAKAEAEALGEALNVSRFPTRTTPRPIKAREMTSETKTADDGRGRRRRHHHHHHRCNRPPFYESEISASFCVPLEAAAEGGRGRCGFVQGFVRVKRRWCHDALRRFLPFFLPCLFSSALTSLILKGRMNNGRTDGRIGCGGGGGGGGTEQRRTEGAAKERQVEVGKGRKVRRTATCFVQLVWLGRGGMEKEIIALPINVAVFEFL